MYNSINERSRCARAHSSTFNTFNEPGVHLRLASNVGNVYIIVVDMEPSTSTHIDTESNTVRCSLVVAPGEPTVAPDDNRPRRRHAPVSRCLHALFAVFVACNIIGECVCARARAYMRVQAARRRCGVSATNGIAPMRSCATAISVWSDLKATVSVPISPAHSPICLILPQLFF
jgi:hypothetical protein